MIETREAVANLDAILSVEGLDGVYVGPNDLSLSLGKPGSLAPETRGARDDGGDRGRRAPATG